MGKYTKLPTAAGRAKPVAIQSIPASFMKDLGNHSEIERASFISQKKIIESSKQFTRTMEVIDRGQCISNF